MLSPDDLSRAGEEVAAVYRQIEDSMVDALAGLLVSGETESQRFETAMQLLSQSAVPRIHEVMERNRAHIDEAARSEVGRWLALSDSDDLSRIKAALGVELPGITAREAASVVEGVAGILSRDNLEMERGAAQAFLRHSTWAVTQVSSGAMTAHAAWREAAVNLAGEGITHITYRDTASGRVTVTNHADVAVRRHIRSQLSQATMSRTLQVCREAGIGFVEVSSHTGARPTHAEWHGRVYSLDGDMTVDGKRYRDFWRGTGYQGKEGPYASLGDRLGGVNCRHTFGPWLPGTPRTYDPDPPHPSGLSNDEVYDLTQKQRAQERRIRATKRELMVAREHAEPGDLGDSVRVAKLEKKLKRQQAGMRKLVDDANARGDARVLTRAYPRESVVGYKPGGSSDYQVFTARSINTGHGFVDSNWQFTHEYGAVYDKYGKLVPGSIVEGDTHRVSFKAPADGWKDKQVYHTHPGDFGGCFSVGTKKDGGDIHHLIDADLLSYNAVCNEGTYSIKRIRELSEAERRKFYRAARKAERNVRLKAYETVADRWCAEGKLLTRPEDRVKFAVELKHEQSDMMHRWFDENALSLGYNYRFTPRKKRYN